MTIDETTSTDEPGAPPRLLRWLERLPKVTIFVGVLVITVGALWTPGVPGAVLTMLIAAVAAFMLYATWPSRTATSVRAVRVLVVVLLAGLGVAKFFV